jgi:probable blue pigment (indigoidine) exporter
MNHPQRISRISTSILTAIAPVLWGTTYVVTTEFLPENRPLVSAVIRTAPAGLMLILLARSFIPSISWKRLAILAFTNIGIFQTMLFVAAYRLPGGVAAMVGSLQPLIVLLLAWTVDRKQPAGITLGAAATGVFGMTLLFSSPDAVWDAGGIAAALIGTASMATGTWLSRRWKNDMPLAGFTGWQLLLGGLFILPLAILVEPPLPSLTIPNWIGYGYLTIMGTALAYSLWFNGISRLSPVAVSSLGLLSPVTAIVLGWGLLGKDFGHQETFGIIVILSSVLLLQARPPSARKTTLPRLSHWQIRSTQQTLPAPLISYNPNKHI